MHLCNQFHPCTCARYPGTSVHGTCTPACRAVSSLMVCRLAICLDLMSRMYFWMARYNRVDVEGDLDIYGHYMPRPGQGVTAHLLAPRSPWAPFGSSECEYVVVDQGQTNHADVGMSSWPTQLSAHSSNLAACSSQLAGRR